MPPRVVCSEGTKYVLVRTDRAKACHAYLRSRGVHASWPEAVDSSVSSIALPRKAEVESVQVLLDQWQRAA